MSESNTTQIANKAGRDLIGRDKIVKTNIYSSKPTHISYLNEMYLHELKEETEVGEYIKELMHLIDRKDGDSRGLEEKLRSASRDNSYINNAKELKELFAKRLIKRDLSPSAQKIFAYLLGKIKLSFQHNIIPSMKSGLNQPQIEEMIFVKVLEPIYDQLEENVLGLTWEELSGMLYFLTGNCHLRWDWYEDATI